MTQRDNFAFEERKRGHSAQFNTTMAFLAASSFALIVLAIVGSIWVQDSVTRTVIQDYRFSLSSIVEEIEDDVDMFRRHARQLSNTTWVKRIAYMQGTRIDPERVTDLDLQEYQQQMHNFALSTNAFELGLIFSKKNIVIGSSAKSDLRYMTDKYVHIDGIGTSDWIHFSENASAMELTLLPDVDVSRFFLTVKCILLCFPASPASAPKSAAMFVLIRHREFARYFDDLFQRGQEMCITVSSLDAETPFLTLGVLNATQKSVIVHESEALGLRFSLTLPRIIGEASVAGVRNTLLAIVGGLWILTAAAMFFLTRRLFRPLRQILSLINDEPPLKRDINEFDSLQHGVAKMKRRVEYLTSEIHARHRILRNVAIGQLLEEWTGESTERERLAQFIEHFDRFSKYCICLIFWKKSEETPFAEVVEETLNAESNERTAFETVILRRAGFYVLAIGYDAYSAFEAVVVSLLEHYQDCRVAIGVEVSSVRELRSSFLAAREAKDYRCVADGYRVLRLDRQRRSNSYFLPQDQENKLLNLALGGQKEEAVRCFEALYEANKKERETTERGMQNFMVNIGLSMMKLLPKSAQIEAPPLPEVDEVETMHRDTVAYIEAVGTFFEHRIRSMPTRMENILAYVDANLLDPALSLDMVADHFHVSASLISRLFTEQHSENYHAYVNRLRIGKAMEILSDEESADLGTVAIRVGYANGTTFRRMFKRFVGVTPSEYRMHMYEK
jgi:AraC-like DNA-binding protein